MTRHELSIPKLRCAVETMPAGTNSHALHPDAIVGPHDVVLDKYRYNAFLCPADSLRREFEARSIEMLIMVGTLTNVCVETTARDGNMQGYKVIVVSDACATKTDEEHNAALLNLCLAFADVYDTNSVYEMLGDEGSGNAMPAKI